MRSTTAHRADATTQAVLDLIISGDVKTGQWLRESEIAKSLGVSRTPVRDALRELAGAGVVVIEQNRGARVRSYSAENIAEIYRTRAMVESTVTAAAVPLLAEADLEHLKALSAQMRAEYSESGSIAEVGRLNREFHAYIFAHSGGHPLAATAEHLLIPMVVTQVMHSYPERKFQRSMDEHDDLIEAIQRQDPEWAEAIMRAHILGGLSSFREHNRRSANPMSDRPVDSGSGA